MNVFIRTLLVTTAALLLTTAGFAQSSAEFNAGGNGGSLSGDQRFISDVAQDGMAKIAIAKLALQNAKSDDVKKYAEQVLADYGNANATLYDIASQQFIALPTGLDGKQLESFDTLSNLQGADFDKAYMQMVLKGQEKDLSRLKQEAAKGNNQTLINWAREMLPTVEDNGKAAKKIHATLTAAEQKSADANKPAEASKPTNADSGAKKAPPSPKLQEVH
jgi:putative membrane protein